MIDDHHPEAGVVACQASPSWEAVGAVRRLAKDGAYSWGPHVRDRLGQRDIDINDAVAVLRLGEIEGPVEPGINPGEWKCKVTARTGRSSRRLGVATVVIRDSHLFLMTVEWEDVK